MKTEILCDNEWLQLKLMTDPENGVGGYVYSHEIRCKGTIIAVLPYRLINHSSDESCFQVQFGLRRETTPCWSMQPKLSALTGGLEPGLTVEETVIEEIREEAGFVVKNTDLTFLGTCFGTKSTDTIYHLYTVDVTDLPQVPATGDGTRLDAEGIIEWHNEVYDADDPIVAMMFLRYDQLARENLI